jgi:hypothetical protein
MKVNISVTSIGVFLVVVSIIILTLRGVSVFRILTQHISSPPPSLKEGFQDGDSDLILTTCPADTKSFVDNGGRTVCCDGEIHGGVCKGSAICSLSESMGNMPTCGQWLGAHLAEKGKNRCPPSMPNYFESPTGGGCTAGARKSDGSGATEGSAACKLYKTQQEDYIHMDSCTNQKTLEETQCFNNSVPSSKALHGLAGAPPCVNCKYTDPVTQAPVSCIHDKSYLNSMKLFFKDPQEFSSWKDGTNNWPAQTKLGFCSVVQKLNIDKTIQLSDVASVQLFK